MRAYDIIKSKRDGQKLNKEEIYFLVNGFVKGEIADYQMSAFLMAVYFQGLSDEETAYLTFAVRDSGEKFTASKIHGIKADKHSTGGVGDKTSLVVMPIVASLGVKVAKMSGRGLGHTGGTVDKLESIPNFKVDLSHEEFIDAVNNIGIAIIGQTKNLAPADKLLYALRDVTATVDSIPLICSSIMGKKLTADDDVIVLDVKVGSGAFMKDIVSAKNLAKLMVETGKSAGKKTVALLTDMSQPLGYTIGNALEVYEAIETLNGNGEKDFEELCLVLSANILSLSGYGDYSKCYKMAKETIKNKTAYNKFIEFVKMQGGDLSNFNSIEDIIKDSIVKEVRSLTSGYIQEINAEEYGLASLALGAGRNKIDDKIDYSAGIILKAKIGDKVEKGQVLALTVSRNATAHDIAKEKILFNTVIGEEKSKAIKLIKETIR